MGLRGYIDGVIGGELVGWALDEDAPERRLEVRGELDGAVLGTVEASELRRDLVTAGFGDGRHGFRIALGGEPLGPGVHPVAAVVGGEALPLAPDWIVRDGDDRPMAGVELATGVAGATSAAVAAQTSAAAPESLVDGEAGWTFALRLGADVVSHARLDAEVAAVEQLYTTAAAHGAVVLAVVFPSKRLLYAEHLPAAHRTDPGERTARRLTARLRDHDEVRILDLHDAMQDARTDGRLYPRTGRELTWPGAVHAYRALAKALALRPHPADAFAFGALEPVAVPVGAHSDDTEPSLTACPATAPGDAPTGLVVHDGAGGRIAELLGLHFARCRVVVADAVDPELVRDVRPDIVVWIREDP